MEKTRRIVDRVLAWVVIALMGASVVNVLWQVFTRWVLRDPSPYTEELARYLLIWIGLLGAAYAAGARLHLAIDLLSQRVGARARQVVDVVIELAVFAFALVAMVGGGLRLVLYTFEFGQISAALGVPLGVVYLAIPLSGLLIVFYAGLDVAARLRALAGGAAPPPPDEAARPSPD